ncbi:DUF3551 domain-containing protein [Bradyrhizobium sp. USDA 4369]
MLPLIVTSAGAQIYDPRFPICMKVYDGSLGGGEWIDCSYTSLPQCQATASGRAAMCVVNPYHARDLSRGRDRRYPRLD